MESPLIQKLQNQTYQKESFKNKNLKIQETSDLSTLKILMDIVKREIGKHPIMYAILTGATLITGGYGLYDFNRQLGESLAR